MTSDADILGAVRANAPASRHKIAAALGIDLDADLSRTLARLVEEKRLHRVALEGPGKATNFVYTLTETGRADSPAPAQPAPEAAPPAAPEKEAPMPRPKKETPSRRQRILALVTETPGSTAALIADLIDAPADAVSRDLYAMEKKGIVAKTSDKRPLAYRIVTDAELPKATYPKAQEAAKAKRTKRAPKTGGKGRITLTIASSPAAPAPCAFRVALTGDRTLLMQRPGTREEIELQPHEIRAVTAFLRDLDNVAAIIG